MQHSIPLIHLVDGTILTTPPSVVNNWYCAHFQSKHYFDQVSPPLNSNHTCVHSNYTGLKPYWCSFKLYWCWLATLQVSQSSVLIQFLFVTVSTGN
jgi:hypothetical protein